MKKSSDLLLTTETQYSLLMISRGPWFLCLVTAFTAFHTNLVNIPTECRNSIKSLFEWVFWSQYVLKKLDVVRAKCLTKLCPCESSMSFYQVALNRNMVKRFCQHNMLLCFITLHYCRWVTVTPGQQTYTTVTQTRNYRATGHISAISHYQLVQDDTDWHGVMSTWDCESESARRLVFESDVIRLAVSWWEMVQYPADQYNEDDIHTHALWNLSVEGTWLWAYFVMWCCKGYINNSKITLI